MSLRLKQERREFANTCGQINFQEPGMARAALGPSTSPGSSWGDADPWAKPAQPNKPMEICCSCRYLLRSPIPMEKDIKII
ncbi:hypothetical protein GRJ2_002007300 [Grus japonensis]|uniref:Uncharacterized protein n=1 Tax=Grus japonensis TaxID=30415 RepID=A0ABC9XE57_GRUJA